MALNIAIPNDTLDDLLEDSLVRVIYELRIGILRALIDGILVR